MAKARGAHSRAELRGNRGEGRGAASEGNSRLAKRKGFPAEECGGRGEALRTADGEVPEAESLDCAQEHRSLTLAWAASSFRGHPEGGREK